MKKLTLLLFLFPFACSAQKFSIGMGFGPAFFSPVNSNLSSTVANKSILPALYSNLDFRFTLTDKYSLAISLANSRLQTESMVFPGIPEKFNVLYALNMNHALLRINRQIADGFYVGITSGFSFYRNPDTILMYELYPNKLPITDRGSGFSAGFQFGYKYPVSPRLDFVGEVAWLYSSIAAYKQIDYNLYAPNYKYSMYPLSFSLYYKFGINKAAKQKEANKENPKKKKWNSYEDEEWGKKQKK